MTSPNLRRITSALLGTTVLIALSACAEAPITHGELGQLQQVASTCQAGITEHYQARIDVSGSGQRSGLTNSTQNAIETEMTRVAICGGGTAQVVLFSAGSAHTVTVFDGALSLPGATENARLRRLPALLEEVFSEIDAGYSEAVTQLGSGATDVVSQFSGAAEFAALIHANDANGSPRVAVTIYTDGEGTTGAGVLPIDATPADALALADGISVPDLSAVDRLSLVGIGQVSGGKTPTSAQVEAWKAFYQRLGEQTGAGSVFVLTEQLGGR